MSVQSVTVIGYPVCIEDDKYHRNALLFNIGTVHNACGCIDYAIRFRRFCSGKRSPIECTLSAVEEIWKSFRNDGTREWIPL